MLCGHTKLGHLPEVGSLLSALSLLAVLGSLPASGWVTRLLAALLLASGSWVRFLHELGNRAHLDD